MNNIEEVKSFCNDCTRCNGFSQKKFFSFGSGQNGIMLVFYGLKNERLTPLDEQEKFFLERMLFLCGVKFSDCFVTSIVKCPSLFSDIVEENCMTFLRWQFKFVKPQIIICFGQKVAELLIDKTFSLKENHGAITEKANVKFSALYEPEKVINNQNLKLEFLSDLMKLFPPQN